MATLKIQSVEIEPFWATPETLLNDPLCTFIIFMIWPYLFAYFLFLKAIILYHLWTIIWCVIASVAFMWGIAIAAKTTGLKRVLFIQSREKNGKFNTWGRLGLWTGSLYTFSKNKKMLFHSYSIHSGMDSYCSGIYSFRFNFSHSVICIHLYALGPMHVAAPLLCHLSTVGGLIFAIFIFQIICIWFAFKRFCIGGVGGHAWTQATALNRKNKNHGVFKWKTWFLSIGGGDVKCFRLHLVIIFSV